MLEGNKQKKHIPEISAHYFWGTWKGLYVSFLDYLATFNDRVDNLFEELHKNSLAVINGIVQSMLMFIKNNYYFKGKGTCILHN